MQTLNLKHLSSIKRLLPLCFIFLFFISFSSESYGQVPFFRVYPKPMCEVIDAQKPLTFDIINNSSRSIIVTSISSSIGNNIISGIGVGTFLSAGQTVNVTIIAPNSAINTIINVVINCKTNLGTNNLIYDRKILKYCIE